MEQAASFIPATTSANILAMDDDDFIFPEFGLLPLTARTSTNDQASQSASRCLLNVAEILLERQIEAETEQLAKILEESDTDSEDGDIEQYVSPIESRFKPYRFDPSRLDPLPIFSNELRKAAPAGMLRVPENADEHAFNKAVFDYIKSDDAVEFSGYIPNFTQILAILYTFGADFSSTPGYFNFLSEGSKIEAITYANSYLIKPISNENESSNFDVSYCIAFERLFALLSAVQLPTPEQVSLFARVLMEIALDKNIAYDEGLRLHIGYLLEKCAQTIPVPLTGKSYEHWLPMHFLAHLSGTKLNFPLAWRLDLVVEALHSVYPDKQFTNYNDFLAIFVRTSQELKSCPERLHSCLCLLRCGFDVAKLTEVQFIQLREAILRLRIRADKQYELMYLQLLVDNIKYEIKDYLPKLSPWDEPALLEMSSKAYDGPIRILVNKTETSAEEEIYDVSLS